MISSVRRWLVAVAIVAIAGGETAWAADGAGTAEFGLLVLAPSESARLSVVNVTGGTVCATRLRIFVMPASATGSLGLLPTGDDQEQLVTLGPGEFTSLFLDAKKTGRRVFRAVANGLGPAGGDSAERSCVATLQILDDKNKSRLVLLR